MRNLPVLISCLALGCGRIGYYPMASEAELAVDAATKEAGDSGRADGGGFRDGGEDSDAMGLGDSGNASAGPPLGCDGERLVQYWGFESDLEQWEYRPPYLEKVAWAPSGHAAPGSIRFETPDAPHGWLVLPAPEGDMRGRRGSVWLKLEAGGPLNVLAYVSNGNDYGADRDVTLSPGEWTCFEFSFDATVTPGFAATDIQIFGFSLNAEGPVTLLVDDVGVR